jgi:hypothetical protein
VWPRPVREPWKKGRKEGLNDLKGHPAEEMAKKWKEGKGGRKPTPIWAQSSCCSTHILPAREGWLIYSLYIKGCIQQDE